MSGTIEIRIRFTEVSALILVANVPLRKGLYKKLRYFESYISYICFSFKAGWPDWEFPFPVCSKLGIEILTGNGDL